MRSVVVAALLLLAVPAWAQEATLGYDAYVGDAKIGGAEVKVEAVDGVQKVYVIGHPKGGGLSISLNDNLFLDCDDCLLHYRAPTEGGSSGSPVFNQQWDLIGLHHAGGTAMRRLRGQEGTYAANEGIWIQRIIKELAASGLQPS